MSFFYLFIYFIVIANILFFKSIAWNLLSQIPYSVSVSVSMIPFPFPDSGFRVLVLPLKTCGFFEEYESHCFEAVYQYHYGDISPVEKGEIADSILYPTQDVFFELLDYCS